MPLHDTETDETTRVNSWIPVADFNLRSTGAGLLGVMLFLVSGLVSVAQEDDGKELPEKEVSASVSEAGSEESLVGSYNQPEWTATHQRFGTTRAYVLPKWVFEFEQFVISENARNGGPAYELQEELKIGLPYRLQLDLYWTQARGDREDSFHAGEHKVEVRWAHADWGKIPLNPTFYVEWETALSEDEDGIEYKVLFAETLGEKWHWASNLIYEESLSEDEQEYGVSTGINYNLIDQKLGIGLEGEWIREKEGSEDAKDSFLLGPSIEWEPSKRTSLRLAPLAGLGGHSPDTTTFLIFGYEFGPGISIKGDGARSGTTTSDVR